MPAVADHIFAAACAAGYPGMKVRGVPGKPDAEAKPGPEAWRKVGDWVEKTGDVNLFWVVTDAINAEWRNLQERLEGI